MLHSLSLFLFLQLAFSGTSNAQFVKVSGKVTDEMGNPMAGATVSFSGSRFNTVTTDNAGNYITLRHKIADTVIRCTLMNYKTTVKKIYGSSTINLKLSLNDDENFLPVIEDSLAFKTETNASKNDSHFIDSILEASKEKIFTKVEIEPGFNGGRTALAGYYRKHLLASGLSIDRNINAVVTVTFLIGIDGNVSNVQLIRGVDKTIDSFIIRLTEQLPKWKPAMQNGRYCKYNYTLSIPLNLTVRS